MYLYVCLYGLHRIRSDQILSTNINNNNHWLAKIGTWVYRYYYYIYARVSLL